MLKKKLALGLLSSVLLSSSAYTTANVGYITGLGGFAMPLKSSVLVDSVDEATQKTLQNKAIPGSSYQAYSIAAGYYVTPKLGIEFSVDYTPEYPLSIELHDNLGTGKTTLRSSSINLGIIYNIGEYSGFDPYVVAGLGWATFKSTGSEDYVKTKAGTNIYKLLPSDGDGVLTGYVGLGVTKAIAANVKLNFQVKAQLYPNLTTRYEQFNTLTRVLDTHDRKALFGVVKAQVGIMFAF